MRRGEANHKVLLPIKVDMEALSKAENLLLGLLQNLLMSFANSNKGGQPPSSLDYAVASRERM